MGKNGDDPNKYRFGSLYIGSGPLNLGINSEFFRHTFQNRIAHDFIMGGDSPYFEILDWHQPSLYYDFGTGNGNSQWE